MHLKRLGFIAAILFIVGMLTGIHRIALMRGFLIFSLPSWWPYHGHFLLGGFIGMLVMFERIVGLRMDAYYLWVPFLYAFSSLVLPRGGLIVRLLLAVALLGWGLFCYTAYKVHRKWEKSTLEFFAYVVLSLALASPDGLRTSPIHALAGFAWIVAVIGLERLELALLRAKFRTLLGYGTLFVWCLMWMVLVTMTEQRFVIAGLTTLVLAIILFQVDTPVQSALLRKPLLTSRTAAYRTAYKVIWAYGWLLIAGCGLIMWNFLSPSTVKDFVYHAFGLGFVLTMILAHAPILMGVINLQRPVFYQEFAFYIFQASTVVRLVTDITVNLSPSFWQWSGWMTGFLHLVSFIVYIISIRFALKPNPYPA